VIISQTVLHFKIQNKEQINMSNRKTTADKIEEAKAKISQYENHMKQLVQKQKQEERKARTKRLIERGAIFESLIPDADALTNEQVKTFLAKTIQTDFAGEILSALQVQNGETATQKPAELVQSNVIPKQQGEGTSAETTN